MSLLGTRQFVLGFHPDRPVVLEAWGAQLSSDGGLLVVREFDERLGDEKRWKGTRKGGREVSVIGP